MHDRYVYFRSVQIKLPPSATQKRGKRRVRAPKHVFARIMVALAFVAHKELGGLARFSGCKNDPIPLSMGSGPADRKGLPGMAQ